MSNNIILTHITRAHNKTLRCIVEGPCGPKFCTRAPNCQKITVSFTNWQFSVSWSLGISFPRPCDNVGSWGPRPGGPGVTYLDSDHAKCLSCCAMGLFVCQRGQPLNAPLYKIRDQQCFTVSGVAPDTVKHCWSRIWHVYVISAPSFNLHCLSSKALIKHVLNSTFRTNKLYLYNLLQIVKNRTYVSDAILTV